MSVDVDAVSERLNGLVTLLKAVGVDALDKGDVNQVSKKFNQTDISLPDARQLNDDQIEAIIKKLQQAQAEAPQIIAALEAHAEARSLTGSQQQVKQQQQQQPPPEEEDDEDDDEFDEDANYPMVGHGISDDISVVSDLTTPTVLDAPVPEEEHYRETLPPMIVGGEGAPAMIIAAPKRKNLVSQVRPGALAPPGSRRNQPARAAGGAAAARRKNYQDTMAKLHENPANTGFVGPTTAPQKKTSSSGKSSSRGPSGGGSGAPKKRPSKPRPQQQQPQHHQQQYHDANDWGSSNNNSNNGWNAFDSKPRPTKSKSSKTKNIDDDGFLVGGSFDPFAGGASSDPFKSSAGDLEFGAFSSNSSAVDPSEHKNPRKARPKKSSGSERNMQSQFSSGGGESSRKSSRPSGERGAPSGGRRRARRASLAT